MASAWMSTLRSSKSFWTPCRRSGCSAAVRRMHSGAQLRRRLRLLSVHFSRNWMLRSPAGRVTVRSARRNTKRSASDARTGVAPRRAAASNHGRRPPLLTTSPCQRLRCLHKRRLPRPCRCRLLWPLFVQRHAGHWPCCTTAWPRPSPLHRCQCLRPQVPDGPTRGGQEASSGALVPQLPPGGKSGGQTRRPLGDQQILRQFWRQYGSQRSCGHRGQLRLPWRPQPDLVLSKATARACQLPALAL
mmetsp:Transcript_135185/g.376635  ORF Transcript_135185/g.376635 Transcript_135185/m.376635 type:complete len:245 (-) Transcript_135185:1722-2456(-)